MKQIVKRNWSFYLMGAAVIIGIKYFCSRAGSDELRWVLTPTAWWVGTLSGIPFEYEPGVGYINYSIRFIIAASCSGVQFMVITIAALIGSFVHRMRTVRKGYCWVGLSLGFSYLFTIFVNGFRIILSIYLPSLLREQTAAGGWLNPRRLHTLIGIAIYFTSLFAAYQAAEYVSRRMGGDGMGRDGVGRDGVGRDTMGRDTMGRASETAFSRRLGRRCIPPLFWYFSIVLGLPFLNSAYKNNSRQFAEYTLLLAAVCSTIIFIFCLVSALNRYIRK